jgi:hypothetical protein
MENCNCGSGSDTAILTVETEVATASSSCCGPESTSKVADTGCCSDTDACSIDCAPKSEEVAIGAVSTGKSSCC